MRKIWTSFFWYQNFRKFEKIEKKSAIVIDLSWKGIFVFIVACIVSQSANHLNSFIFSKKAAWAVFIWIQWFAESKKRNSCIHLLAPLSKVFLALPFLSVIFWQVEQKKHLNQYDKRIVFTMLCRLVILGSTYRAVLCYWFSAILKGKLKSF